ncbi:MAG: 1-deoxy-D-xylulose-5-phosphate reductoisomerase [bacterium]
MKKIILLGSTGSIGRNAIEVVENLDGYKIVGLAAYKNHRMLLKQTQWLKPKSIALVDKKHYNSLKTQRAGAKVFCGESGITEMIETTNADILIAAFASAVGIYGIKKAIEKRLRLCLATKEILVSFGDIIMKEIRQHNMNIIPIDSEHSAIYQCLEGRNMDDVNTIILTASGGPFLKKSMKNVTKSDVLNHPVWKMGAKITVDSATMMNKGLEVIEAHHLFQMPPERIKVIIHPEAICHSLVQFIDGTLIAQLSTPDMKLPIQHSLTSPGRRTSSVKYLDMNRVKRLEFIRPDFKKFPCLLFAYEALKAGKSMPSVLNAANEEVVRLFLENKIKFRQIPQIIKKVMNKHRPQKGSIKDYIEWAAWAKQTVRSLV